MENKPKSPSLGAKLWDLKWQIFAGGALIFGLLMVKGGLAALGPLLKFALPVGIAAYGFRFVKQKLMATAGEAFKKKFEDAMRMQQPGQGGRTAHTRRPQDDGKVIDLCPKCGSYLAAGHRCKA